MTTLAFRDGVLAADTMVSGNGTVLGFTTKIIRRGKLLAGFTGSTALGGRFLDWVRRGCDAYPPPMGHYEADHAAGVLFPPDGGCLVYNPLGWERRSGPFFAFGSGADKAIGAMAAGACAESAVRAAMDWDLATGGEVTVLRAETKAERYSRQREAHRLEFIQWRDARALPGSPRTGVADV